MMKYIIGTILLLVALLALAGYITNLGDDNIDTVNEDAQAIQQQVDQARESVPQTVATVNGIAIDRDEFFRLGEQLASAAQSAGQDINQPAVQNQISQQAITILVNQQLVTEAAIANGDTGSTTVVDTAGGSEQLAEQAATAGIDIETIRADLLAQSQQSQHLENQLNLSELTVTSVEISDFYQTLLDANGTSTPAIEDITADIEQQILLNKQEELINTYLQELLEAATVEILL